MGLRGRKAPATHFQLRFQLWARRAQELLWGDGRVATFHIGLRTHFTFSIQLFLARPLCRNVSGIFVVSILEVFAGDLLGGFFWALLPTKTRRNKPATKSAENKNWRPRNKNPRKNPPCQPPTLIIQGNVVPQTCHTTLNSFYEARVLQDAWAFSGGCRICALFKRLFWRVRRDNTIVTGIITKLICWDISPVMFRSTITGLFHPVVHCRIVFTEFRSECHRIGERQGVFGNGPQNYQINLLGILPDNDPVKSGRK